MAGAAGIRAEGIDVRAATPPPAPLEMPIQALRRGRRRPGARGGPWVMVARLVTFGGAALLTWHAAATMLAAISIGPTSGLQYALLALFAATFAWIALASSAALAGLLPRPRFHRAPDGPLPAKTALVMPVYNEDPAETAAALLAMGRGVADLGHGDRFELFVISDTTLPEVWMRETAAVEALRRALGGRIAVWYRRRYRNTGRKAGNVADFVRRFGGRYDAFVLLDADSLMAPETLVAMARELEADPRLALLQTVPRLAGGRGLWARMHQFAGRVYGPVVARGVAAWQGFDGNYWGHNAILRTRAFAETCGLPVLRGRKPFGGHILSHDFVEAALLRRAGWTVRMDPDLEGSYEKSPPTLLDFAQRDRRWAQGNLQHAGLLGAAGLAPISRAHFLFGILGYLASPLWLALILVGLALSVVAATSEPEYFSKPFQLFPDWPRFDSARLVYLFALSMAVLLLPKVLGVARALSLPELRRAAGGGVRLIGSALLELLVSSLYAPILMGMQTRQILEILAGQDSGWSSQHRADGSTPWGTSIRRHAGHTALGIGTAVLLGFTTPQILGWMAPTLLGLVFSIWLSRLSGSGALGDALRRARWLRTPEERSPPRVMRKRDEALGAFRKLTAGADLGRLARDPAARRAHFAWVEPLPRPEPGQPDSERLAAEAKVADAKDLQQAWGWMTPAERLVLLSHADWFGALVARTPRGTPPRATSVLAGYGDVPRATTSPAQHEGP
jgi:membrane glycosyltransferase